MQVPQTHGARVPEAVGIGIGYVDTIFALTDQHDPVDRHLLRVRSLGSLGPLLEIGAHLFVKLGGVAALLFEGCTVRCQAEDTLLDDRSGVRLRHFKLGTVVPGIYQGEVSGINFVGTVGLEVLEIRLVTDLMNDIDVIFRSLIWVRCLGRHRCLLLGSGTSAGI